YLLRSDRSSEARQFCRQCWPRSPFCRQDNPHPGCTMALRKKSACSRSYRLENVFRPCQSSVSIAPVYRAKGVEIISKFRSAFKDVHKRIHIDGKESILGKWHLDGFSNIPRRWSSGVAPSTLVKLTNARENTLRIL